MVRFVSVVLVASSGVAALRQFQANNCCVTQKDGTQTGACCAAGEGTSAQKKVGESVEEEVEAEGHPESIWEEQAEVKQISQTLGFTYMCLIIPLMTAVTLFLFQRTQAAAFICSPTADCYNVEKVITNEGDVTLTKKVSPLLTAGQSFGLLIPAFSAGFFGHLAGYIAVLYVSGGAGFIIQMVVAMLMFFIAMVNVPAWQSVKNRSQDKDVYIMAATGANAMGPVDMEVPSTEASEVLQKTAVDDWTAAGNPAYVTDTIFANKAGLSSGLMSQHSADAALRSAVWAPAAMFAALPTLWYGLCILTALGYKNKEAESRMKGGGKGKGHGHGKGKGHHGKGKGKGKSFMELAEEII